MKIAIEASRITGNPSLVTSRRQLGQTGLWLSAIGFGASPLGDVFNRTSPDADADAVACAIDSGINFFDVSPYYGVTKAETRLGTALAGRRHQVVVATKCGRYGAEEFDFSASRITHGLEDSLRRLQTDFVDLLQAHDTEFATVDQIVEETVPAMRRLQQQGKARYIGITGYSLSNLLRIAARVPVDSILSYCRYNLLTTNLDEHLLPFVEQHAIGLINASPLSMGLLTRNGPPSWHPAPQAIKACARAIVQLCEERGVDPATLALQFACAHPYAASTLVGMATRAQVEANVAALRRPVEADLLEACRKLAEPASDLVWSSGLPENYG